MNNNNEAGITLDQTEVKKILTDLVTGTRFSEGSLGVAQATNAILRLQRPPENALHVALTVVCNYCGATPGNPCRRAGATTRRPHPSRVDQALWSAGYKG